MTKSKEFQLVPAARILAISFFYAVVAYSCLQLSFHGTNATPVWPPSGIAFTVVWFLGYRVWPAIWMGAFMANMMIFSQQGWSLAPSLTASSLIGIGNSIEAVFAVFLLHSLTKEKVVLSKIGDIFKFLFAVLAACTSSASIGTSTVYFTHPFTKETFDMIWFTWWLGDVVGMTVIASTFLTFHKALWQINSWRNFLEAVLVFFALIIVNSCVFVGKYPEFGFYSHVTYLILPFAIWSTYRFGFPGATVSLMTTSIVAVVGSILHLGPFVGLQVPENLVIVECFIGVIAVTVLTLAAALYERSKAEQNIKYNEARFRSLVENSFEVIALVDTKARVLYSSPSTKNVLGYENAEVLGHSMFRWMHPQDISSIVEIFKSLLKEQGTVTHASCRLKRKDGSWRWMEGTGCNLLHDPAIGAVVINYRDVTDRKLSQEHFEQVVEFSPVAQVMVNRQGEIQLVNRTAEKLFGYNREELLKMKVESLVPVNFRSQHPFYRDEFHAEPGPRPMNPQRELYALRKDGHQVPVEIGLTPIETEQGLCTLASIMDVTQRRKAEEILKRDKESLERLVDERSKELIKTQKELKQFSRLADIGTLAATVAHELRNPLGVIQLAAYNLKKEKVELAANKHLTNIEKKVWEGNQIIDNLLSYARIKIPNYEDVRFYQILDECVSSVQGRFAEKGITVEKKYNDNLGVIEADPAQIREIFLNVLNNACQSFANGSGKVDVTAEHVGEMIKVGVKDRGVGIASEDLDKVFEPFFTRKSKGTGLGLTICSELVNMHQGKIEIESQVGVGTTIYISLPIQRRNHVETAAH